MAQETTHGSWKSIIGSADIAAGGRRLFAPQISGDFIYWLEGRASEGGRQRVVRAPLDAPQTAHEDVTPHETNVRTRVHEYGGGDYLVVGDEVFFVDFADQRVYVTSKHGVLPVSAPDARYADFTLSPDRRFLVAVEERDQEGGEPENRLVCFVRGSSGEFDPSREVLFAGTDFVSTPVFSPDGSRLAFITWQHPDMPWDATELMEIGLGENGQPGDAHCVAGAARQSIVQPGYSTDGVLTFVSDCSGYWNLYQRRGDEIVALCPLEAEFAGPAWVFGLSWYDFVDADHILCVRRESGQSRLAMLDIGTGSLHDFDLAFCEIGYVRVEGQSACFVAGGALESVGVHLFDLQTGKSSCAETGSDLIIDEAWISKAEVVSFPSEGGRMAHGYFYAPKNPDCAAPAAERPPLLVKSHGGPTSAASAAFDPRIQYWTTRGYAVLDVDYAGSTGYGAAYRHSLDGHWGVYDVEDCVAGACWLASEARVDGQRLAISGGSAGGYTTLCALTFHDVFKAGASHYGIGDLEALARDTHKFESRYLDGLIGPYPERADLYRARSPIHATERLSCPVIFFQGLEDKIVPPNQAFAMAEALELRGVAHSVVTFEGEQHGFRQASNIRTAIDGEAWFYGKVFGFDAGPAPDNVALIPGRGIAG